MCGCNSRYDIKQQAWKLLTDGKKPYFDISNDDDVIRHVVGGGRLPRPITAQCPSSEVWRTVEGCWAKKKKGRPTFKSLADWFRPKKSRAAAAVAVGSGSSISSPVRGSSMSSPVRSSSISSPVRSSSISSSSNNSKSNSSNNIGNANGIVAAAVVDVDGCAGMKIPAPVSVPSRPVAAIAKPFLAIGNRVSRVVGAGRKSKFKSSTLSAAPTSATLSPAPTDARGAAEQRWKEEDARVAAMKLRNEQQRYEDKKSACGKGCIQLVKKPWAQCECTEQNTAPPVFIWLEEKTGVPRPSP